MGLVEQDTLFSWYLLKCKLMVDYREIVHKRFFPVTALLSTYWSPKMCCALVRRWYQSLRRLRSPPSYRYHVLNRQLSWGRLWSIAVGYKRINIGDEEFLLLVRTWWESLLTACFNEIHVQKCSNALLEPEI